MKFQRLPYVHYKIGVIPKFCNSARENNPGSELLQLANIKLIMQIFFMTRVGRAPGTCDKFWQLENMEKTTTGNQGPS